MASLKDTTVTGNLTNNGMQLTGNLPLLSHTGSEVIDDLPTIDADMLGGQLPGYYATSANLLQSISKYDALRIYYPEELCWYNGYVWSHMSANIASCTAGELICTISGRGFYKTNSEPAYIGYHYWAGTGYAYTGTLLVGRTATSVGFYTSEGVHFDTGTAFTYNGETWYWNGADYAFSGDLTSTAGKAMYKASGASDTQGSATALLNYVKGKTPGTNYIVWGVPFSNDNLIVNHDYRNPVNQRGLSTYTGNDILTIDMVRALNDVAGQGAKLSLVNTGIKVEPVSIATNTFCYSQHRVEWNPKTPAGLYTFSLEIAETTAPQVGLDCYGLANGSIYTIGTCMGTTGIISVTGTIAANTTLLFLNCALSGLTSLTQYTVFSRIKLESGSISTLANDPPSEYGVELQKCLRYYWDSTAPNFGAGGIAIVNNALMTNLRFPVPMRITPTCTFYNSGTANHVRSTNVGTDIAITTTATYANQYGINFFTVSGTPFTVGQGYDFRVIASADL
jgi:hypothetical protein